MRSNNLFARHFLTLLLLTFSFDLLAQEVQPGYFLFPIKPGKQNYLSGNMGELRSNHFHAGLDIKTDQRTGLPVHAAADGYISRAKASSYGYGNVLYMLHPNGMTTVYGHLDRFGDSIAAFMRDAQYLGESFEMEVFPPEGRLYYKKGDTIAWSGNSGSSGGPHLHFEIRDRNQWVLNPLKFGFTEIVDNMAPVLQKVEINTLSINSRADGEFGQSFYTARRNGDKYYLSDTIRVHGPIGIGIKAYDPANGTSNRNGVSKVECLVDGKQTYFNDIQTYSFAESRYINRHIDFRTLVGRGERYQKMYVEPDNELGFYKVEADQGILNFKDNTAHQVEIRMWDALENLSTVTFNIKAEPLDQITDRRGGSVPPRDVDYQIHGNVLKMIAKNSTVTSSASIYRAGKSEPLPIAYNKGNDAVYLWDLRNGMPDSVNVDGRWERFHFATNVMPGQKTTFKNEYMAVTFGPRDIYDTLYLEVEKAERYSENYYQQVRIGDAYTPFRSNAQLTLWPDKPVPDETKAAVYQKSGSRLSYEGGTWENGYINFSSRDLGTFVIADDESAPYIKVLSASPSSLRFQIGDNFSGIGSFTATVNGKWVLMNHDYKRNLIWSDEKSPLKGDFKLVVKDKVGNEKVYETKL